MQRLRLRERADWRRQAAQVGFEFLTDDGTPYWDEVLHLEPMLRHGMINAEDLNLFYRTDSVDEAFALSLIHI